MRFVDLMMSALTKGSIENKALLMMAIRRTSQKKKPLLDKFTRLGGLNVSLA